MSSQASDTLDGGNTAVSFANDIVPLFRPLDVQCMKGKGVFLISYDYMKDPDNAKDVLDRLEPGAGALRMPQGGPYWSDESLALFQAWINGGFQP